MFSLIDLKSIFKGAICIYTFYANFLSKTEFNFLEYYFKKFIK